MSNGALTNLISAASLDYGYQLEKLYELTKGTPIERAFETALHAVLGMSSLCGADVKLVRAPEGTKLTDLPDDPPVLQTGDVWYWPQYQFFSDWRVDFVVGAYNRNVGRAYIVVECDGHDFHERTKEQAEKDRSRDRRLQDAGYRIYRFTGREIYRDAYDCALQVLMALSGMSARMNGTDSEDDAR